MKKSMEDLVDSIDGLIQLRLDWKVSSHREEYGRIIKQQKIVIGACLDILLIELKQVMLKVTEEATKLAMKEL